MERVRERKKLIGYVVCNKKQHEGTLIVVSHRDFLDEKVKKTVSRKKYHVVSCPKINKEDFEKDDSKISLGSIVEIQYLPKRISKRKITELLQVLKSGRVNETKQ